MAPVPAAVAPSRKETASSSDKNSSNTPVAVNPEDSTPSNISVVSANKEEGLETGPIPPSVEEYDYPDGGLRGQ